MGWRTPIFWLLVVVAGNRCLLAVEVDEPEAGRVVPENATLSVLRCCTDGQDLYRADQGAEVRCVRSDVAFRPIIYSPEIGDYLKDTPAWWSFRQGVRPRCRPTEVLRYVPRSNSNPYFLFESGMVVTELETGIELDPGDYCLGSNGLLACVPRSEGQPATETFRPRIRKCCGENAAYHKKSCVGLNDESATGGLENERASLLGSAHNDGLAASLGMTLVSGFPVCRQPDNFTIVGDMDVARLQMDGSVFVNDYLIPREEFCVERLKNAAGRVLPAKVFACFEHAARGSSEATKSDIRFTLYPVGLIISAIFLAATLATGWLLPASHHVLHWRCQTYHVACLMLGDICMAVIQLAGYSLKDEFFCRVLAILAHFFFLATFFWLNTMCFNIWWTFRDLRPSSLEKGQELLRLRFYAAYAWGGPLIVAGLAAVLDHLPESPDRTILRPHFGEKHCWFIGNMEILAYFYAPIGILLVINLLFFAATARELTCGLWKGELVKSTTERLRALPRSNEKSRKRSDRRAALGKVCLKLVVVMGVPWIFDVISWWVGGPNFLWYVTDLLNALQGVFIFIVVGCQPQVRAALKRLWSRNPRANANRQGNGLSTTSHGIPSMGDSLTGNPSTKTAPLETIC